MNMKCQLALAVLMVNVAANAFINSSLQADEGANGKSIWIYRDIPSGKDTRSDSERLFAPFGFMPAERADQIAVNAELPVDKADASKGTAVEIVIRFDRPTDWAGTYWLLDNGTAWGTKPGIDCGKLLAVRPETKLALRFRAAGSGRVSFKIGGVADGPHRSSLAFAKQLEGSPVKLTERWMDYTIGPLTANSLRNLVDPMCVVASGLDQGGAKEARILVDNIRIELFDLPQAADQGAEQKNWRQALQQTLFICYTPTGFDPTVRPVKQPSEDDIRQDLAAIRSLADASGVQRTAIITYGCRDGLEAIPALARDAKLGVLLGIFNPRDQTEVSNAKSLLEQDSLRETILAVSVGNEAITFKRATLPEIVAVAQGIKTVRPLPCTTTEIVQAYGEEKLFDFDFSLVNAHAIFADVRDPDAAAAWAVDRIGDVCNAAKERDGHVVLIKEIGWPSGPEPFDDKQQEKYWKHVLSHPNAKMANICIFDSFKNVDWKEETITLRNGSRVNIGPHWPVLFGTDRKQTPYAANVIKWWMLTRTTN